MILKIMLDPARLRIDDFAFISPYDYDSLALIGLNHHGFPTKIVRACKEALDVCQGRADVSIQCISADGCIVT